MSTSRLKPIAIVAIALAATVGLQRWLRDLPWRLPPVDVRRRFAYVVDGQISPDTGQPVQTLWLAQLTAMTPTAADRVHVVTLPPAGPPEHFEQLAVSPGNRWLAARSVQLPADAVDHNIMVRGMSGIGGMTFNEHRFVTMLSRATVDLPPFHELLAQLKNDGAPADFLASLDFAILVDGDEGANVESPLIMRWVDDDRLYLRWQFRVGVPEVDAFDHIFDLVVGGFDGPTLLLLGTTAPPLPPLPPILALTPSGVGPAALAALAGKPIKFFAPSPTLAALGALPAGTRSAALAASSMPI